MMQRVLDLLYALVGYVKGYMDAVRGGELRRATDVIEAQRVVAAAARDSRDERLRRMARKGRVRD